MPCTDADSVLRDCAGSIENGARVRLVWVRCPFCRTPMRWRLRARNHTHDDWGQCPVCYFSSWIDEAESQVWDLAEHVQAAAAEVTHVAG